MASINWHIIGASVQGASHIRQDKPNQDAWHDFKSPSVNCIAVADGHGSAQTIPTVIRVLNSRLKWPWNY